MSASGPRYSEGSVIHRSTTSGADASHTNGRSNRTSLPGDTRSSSTLFGTSKSTRHREVIELIDSDTDTPVSKTSSKSKTNASAPSSSSSLSRSSTHYDPTREGRTSTTLSVPPAKSTNRASASPSLSSLLNGPPSPPPQIKPPSINPPQMVSTPPATEVQTNNSSPPQAKAEKESSKLSASNKRSAPGVSTTTSNVSSPKPRSAVPVKGNGLLAGAFGEELVSNEEPEPEVPTIVLSIPIAQGETNKYVNFARLAEQRYGLEAINPRLARAKMGLGGGASGDEMLMDASESESAMEDKPGSATDTAGPVAKKKRRKNEEVYDANDPFIDDTEMLWEEQAATSKEGFFVYAGPLVPEGEKAQIERAEGSAKRGRGRGTRATGSSRGSSNAGKPVVPRKPRVTKATKEKMDREKEEREKAGMKIAAMAMAS